MEQNASEPVVSKQQKSNKKPLLITLVGIVLILASCSGTYYWQHQKLKMVDDKLTTVTKQNGTLKDTLASSQKQYNQAKATIESYQAKAKAADSPLATIIATQSDLALTVVGAQYVNPDGTVTEGGKWFGVNMTLTNNTTETISISDADFQLKDSQNNSYPEETIQGASTLPDGWVSLPNTTLAPGETIRGSVTFQMPNTNVKNFNFMNVTKPLAVTSSN